MADRITIVGAGYTGMRLARRALDRGYEVGGTTRDTERGEQLRNAGADVVAWDVLDDDPADLGELLGPRTAVVYSIPTLFDAPENDRHVEPVRRVLDAAADAGCERFVYLSSTSVYGDHGGRWVDEESPRRPTSPVGIMRRDIEDAVLAEDRLAANVVRIVGIYGPGRTLDRYVAGGRYKLVDGGEKLTNRIHVDDLVEIVFAVIDRAPDRRIYVAADGSPVRVVDLVDWLVDRCGIDRPEEVSLDEYRRQRGEDAAARWKNTYLASNRRVVDELGVKLQYPSVLDGYAAIFDR